MLWSRVRQKTHSGKPGTSKFPVFFFSKQCVEQTPYVDVRSSVFTQKMPGFDRNEFDIYPEDYALTICSLLHQGTDNMNSCPFCWQKHGSGLLKVGGHESNKLLDVVYVLMDKAIVSFAE